MVGSVSKSQVVGVVLVCLGLVVLFVLRSVLVQLLLFILEFLGILIGFILILLGLGLIFGKAVVWRKVTSWSAVSPETSSRFKFRVGPISRMES